MMAVLVNDGAAPISVNDADPAGCDSTRIAVASGALFVQVRLIWLERSLSPEGSSEPLEGPGSVVTVTSLE